MVLSFKITNEQTIQICEAQVIGPEGLATILRKMQLFWAFYRFGVAFVELLGTAMPWSRVGVKAGGKPRRREGGKWVDRFAVRPMTNEQAPMTKECFRGAKADA